MWYATKKAVKNAPYVLYVSSNFLQKRYPNNFNNISCSDVDLQPVKQDVLDQRLEKIKNMNKNKPLVLCTIANVDVKYKRQDLVIKAISELNKQGYNFEYRLVGGGDKARLQSIAEKYSVADKVIFEGSVPHEKVFDYLDDIDIYIQPSDAESHGRAILEAMSRGCPCIGSSTGGIPELIDASFIFKRRNVKEIVSILASFTKKQMMEQARRNFEFAKRFDKKLLDDKRNVFLNSFKKYSY
jgi:glycosyltransferase involved in cell wall biosynthesis